MALIKVCGYIANDLTPKKGQSGHPYISFGLLEITGYGEKQWRQHYQVWAWGSEDVDRLTKLGVKKGSKVGLTGKLKLVDAYNSVKHAGGWANLEMLTRRYGSHSFESDREKLNQKMDDFLDGKAEQTAQPIDTEQALKALAQADPALLMEIVKSVQFANKT